MDRFAVAYTALVKELALLRCKNAKMACLTILVFAFPQNTQNILIQ